MYICVCVCLSVSNPRLTHVCLTCGPWIEKYAGVKFYSHSQFRSWCIGEVQTKDKHMPDLCSPASFLLLECKKSRKTLKASIRDIGPWAFTFWSISQNCPIALVCCEKVCSRRLSNDHGIYRFSESQKTKIRHTISLFWAAPSVCVCVCVCSWLRMPIYCVCVV